jgi:DnaJ family protein C protein 7
MSTLVDVRSPNGRENEGQGVRNGVAQQPGQFYGGISSSETIWGNPKNPNPNFNIFANANPGGMPINLDSNTNINSSAASSFSSSGSFGDARFHAGFSGLNRTDSGKETMFNSSSAMGDGINYNANANFGPFASAPFSTSRASFSFASNNVFNIPSKDAAGPFQAEASTSAQRNRPVATQRPRLMKVRRNLNSSKGKSAAFTGKLFDGENSSGVEKSGYNPFQSNSNAGSNQTGYCFKRDLNQSSSTSTSFSNVFGENIGNQGFKPVQDDHPKPFAKNDSAKQNDDEDLGSRIRCWNPFVGTSGNVSGVAANSYFKKHEDSRGSFTFRGSTEDKLASKNNSENDHLKPFEKNDSAKQNDDEELGNRMRGWNPFVGTSGSGSGVAANSYFKKYEDSRGSFTFRGNMDDRLASKNKSKNNVNLGGGGSVSGWSGAVNVGSTVDEVNYARNSSDSMACNEQRTSKPSEMNSSSVDGHLYNTEDAAQGAFVFTTATKPKISVRSRHKQDLRTGGCDNSSGLKQAAGTYDGPFASQASNTNTNRLKKNVDEKYGNPFTNQASLSGSFSRGACTFDNPFAAEMPLSRPKFASSAADSSVGLTTGSSIPSTFIFNAGGKFECGSNKAASPLVEPFSFSEGSASGSAAHAFSSGSTIETANKVNLSSSTGEMGAIPTNYETPQCEGKSSRKDNSWPAMGSLFSSLNQTFEFNASNELSKSHSTRKKREKYQLPTSIQRKLGRRSTPKLKRYVPCSTPANHTEGGSPMDFSPYNETASKDEFPFGNHNMPDLGQSSSTWETSVQYGAQTSYNLHESLVMEAKVEELRAAAVNLHIGTDKEMNAKSSPQEKPSKGGENLSWQRSNSACEAESFIPDRYNNSRRPSAEEQISIPSSESEWLNSEMEKVRIDDGGAKAEAEESSQSKQFAFAYSSVGAKAEESSRSRQFTFASPSPNSTPSASRRHARRSHRTKNGENINPSSCDIKIDSSPFTTQPFVFQMNGMQRDILNPNGDMFQGTKQKDEEHKGNDISEPFSSMSKHKEESGATVISNVVKSAAAEQACEKWRLRGNQAYANGDFPKAEDCYSRGASIVSPNETSESCIRASMLCYSNRAATRMAVGRMREALADCKRAMAIDPNFLRVQIRAASCHLSLGESEAAVALFKGCLCSVKDVIDLKIAAEASEGVRKAQQGQEYGDRAAELLDTRNPGDATNALRIVNEALSFSPHSERLLELKALALLILRKYEELIQVCEQSLDLAERNYCFANNDDQICNEDSLESLGQFPVKLWRWRMCAKAHFYLGRLEEALDLLLKYEEVNSAVEKYGKESMESLTSFTATIHDLLRHKAAGNKAFQEGKHAEAVEHYTAALACNGESRPFTAVCFCNRAAASQALGHIADAIADCSRAIALDPHYPKAISRRATLHEIVRDYGQATIDLQKLTTLLESQQRSKASQPGRLGSSSTSTQDLRQACERLAKAEEEMKRENPLDHYLILGVEASSTAAEIKKAYRKAALRHHPDKAGQFSVRSDNGDDGYWNEVGEKVRRDAERLFKMIGEAYAILSDPGKRMRYDAEEEVRKLRTRGSSSGSETVSEAYHYQYEKGSRRQRDRWDSWNGYSPYQRWQNGPDAAQPDMYARRGSNNSRSGDGSRWSDWDYF